MLVVMVWSSLNCAPSDQMVAVKFVRMTIRDGLS
ncbi:MAG: hypothetical protein ACJAR2_000559 [Ilumatobacter sp.]|jgi:hypothetical protein